MPPAGVKNVDRHTQIPAAFAGHIVKIHRIFWENPSICSHEIFAADGRWLLSAFGHTVPRDSLQIGQHIAAGEIIGAVSGVAGTPTDLPPHLHLTFAWVPADFSPAQLTWKNLGADPGITLIDPLPVILARI